MKKCMTIVSLLLMLALLTSPLSVVASAEEMVQSRVLADRLSNGSETDEASVSSFDMVAFSNGEDTAIAEPQSKACYYNNGKLNETDLDD